jgi:Amt family ammonium transporter
VGRSRVVDETLDALAAHGMAGFFGILVLLKLIGLVMPLRASEHQEAIGMDVIQHGEEAYVTGEGAILITPESGIEAELPVADPT